MKLFYSKKIPKNIDSNYFYGIVLLKKISKNIESNYLYGVVSLKNIESNYLYGVVSLKKIKHIDCFRCSGVIFLISDLPCVVF